MINSKVGWLMISVLFVAGLVTALEVKKTEFVIKTEPYQNLSVKVLDASNSNELDIFEGRARKFGEYRFTYYGTVSKIKVVASIMNNATQEELKQKTFGPYTLGATTETIEFYLSSQENTAVNKENSANQSAQVETGNSTENPSIQGAVINETSSKLTNRYYLIAAAVVAIGALLFVFRKKLTTSKSGPVEPHPSKVISSKTKPAKKEITPQIKQQKIASNMEDTEKRIKELQKQLDDVRNEEKIVNLQKQLNKERQSLKSMQDEGQNQESKQMTFEKYNPENEDKNN